MVLDPFQILLNSLSHELNGENLQSLIHVCGEHIPGGQREKISSGWDVFSILRQQNIIGSDPEKVLNLLKIIKEMKPKRKDLVSKVKQYIEYNYEESEMILNDFESSGESSLPFISRSSTPIPTEDCCRIRCCGFTGFTCNCAYNPCCDASCCCVILVILFSFLAVVAALAWYSGIPRITKHLKSTEDLRDAGPFVVGVLGFLAVCSGLCVIYIRYVKRRDETYAVLPCSHQTSNQASYGSSDSTRTSSYPRRIDRRSIQRSCSSDQFTALDSLASRASRASSRNPRPLEESDVVPDGVPRDSFPEFFTQEV